MSAFSIAHYKTLPGADIAPPGGVLFYLLNPKQKQAYTRKEYMLAICLFKIPYGFCPLLGRGQMLLDSYDCLFFVPGLHSLKDSLMLFLYAV